MPAEATSRAVPFLTRVRIRNYKSIAECDVVLGPLTVLLGLNASGKSNFLDALMFARDAVETTPQEAFRARGGAVEVLHRDSVGGAVTLVIELDICFTASGSPTSSATPPTVSSCVRPTTCGAPSSSCGSGAMRVQRMVRGSDLSVTSRPCGRSRITASSASRLPSTVCGCEAARYPAAF